MFNSAICSEVLEYDENPQKIIKEISRVLKKGGTLLLTTPTKDNIRIPSDAITGYSYSELKNMMRRYNLTITKISYHLKTIGYFLWRIDKTSGFLEPAIFPFAYLLTNLDNFVGGKGKAIFLKAKKL